MSSKIIIIGRFGGPHGVKGYVRIHSFTEPTENILNYKSWLVGSKNDWKSIQYQQAQMHHKGIIVKIDGYQDRELVKQLTNRDIAITREQLPKLDHGQHYWEDLKGMRVFTPSDDYLGTVDYIVATGSNDVLVVKHGDKKHLIPYLIDQYIKSIDIDDNKIIAEWDPNF